MAEHPAGHIVLKWLIENDKALAELGREGTTSHSFTIKALQRFQHAAGKQFNER